MVVQVSQNTTALDQDYGGRRFHVWGAPDPTGSLGLVRRCHLALIIVIMPPSSWSMM